MTVLLCVAIWASGAFRFYDQSPRVSHVESLPRLWRQYTSFFSMNLPVGGTLSVQSRSSGLLRFFKTFQDIRKRIAAFLFARQTFFACFLGYYMFKKVIEYSVCLMITFCYWNLVKWAWVLLRKVSPFIWPNFSEMMQVFLVANDDANSRCVSCTVY